MRENVVSFEQSAVLQRQPWRTMPVIERGEGVYLFDASGRRYFDASAGALVVSVGHGNRFVADAVHAQLCRVGYVNGTHFTSQVTEALAARLVALARQEIPGAQLGRVALLCSGSEAIEAAVKFCRQLQVERGQPQRHKVIARTPSYHGNTLHALSLSARPAYRRFFGPLLATVPTVSAPWPTQRPNADATFYADELDALIAREGADTIAAFIAEPVMGSSTGASVPPQGYFERVRERCDAHGILFIADEVMCGAGRTGNFFASRTVNAAPDVLVLGKGLGGGLAPVSAVLVREAHFEEMRRGSGSFQHAQTYLQAPFLSAAALAVLNFFEREQLVAHVAKVGAYFQRRLREALATVPYVGAIQGVGLMAGVDLFEGGVAFPRALKVIERLCAALFARGVVVWPNSGHANGVDGDLFMLGPPLVITEAQVDELVTALTDTLTQFNPRGDS